MIDIVNEHVITLAEACRILPGRPSLSTLWRWRQRGVRGVRLATALVGGKRVTSAEALQRFVAATTAAADSRETTLVTAHRREAAVRRAERDLDANDW